MPKTHFSKSWACLHCGWTLPVGIEPDGEYFTDLMLFIANGREIKGCPANTCPSCYYHPDPEQRSAQVVEQITDLSRPDLMIETNTATDEELAAETKEDVDADGNTIMEQTGERETLSIVDGKPAVVTEPVFEPKQRELTKSELADLKEQRDRNLDALSSIAVQELSDPEPINRATPTLEADPGQV